MKRRKLRDGHKRHQALIGEIVGATISSAAMLGSAGITAQATRDGAEKESAAILENAAKQAEAIEKQGARNEILQKQQIDTIKNENKEMRTAMSAAQFNNQYAAAAMNTNNMLQGNRIVAKRGLITRNNSFYGGGIRPIDGGTVIPIQVDNTGEIYMITGDTHNQSHIAPDGKIKTGVGLKVPKRTNKSGETEIEAEGGELIKQYPNGDTAILSRRTIAGINPAKTVLQGGDFDNALIYQEMNKKKENNSRRKKASLGANIGYSAGIAGINAIGNLGGAAINYVANKKAGNLLDDAYTQAGNLMSNAYQNLRTIDPSIINRKDFAATHAMAGYRAPVVSTNTQWTEGARMKDSLLKQSRTGSLSSAARFNRSLRANQTYIDYGNKSQHEADLLRENIAQENVKMANNIALANAQMDTESSKAYLGQRLALAQYNNDIINKGILGSAESLATAKTNVANNWANIYAANAQGFANALTNSVNTGLAAFNNYQTYDNNLEMALLGADEDAVKAFYKRKGLDPLTGRRIKRNNNNSVG